MQEEASLKAMPIPKEEASLKAMPIQRRGFAESNAYSKRRGFAERGCVISHIPYALKGQKLLAQGNALGFRINTAKSP